MQDAVGVFQHAGKVVRDHDHGHAVRAAEVRNGLIEFFRDERVEPRGRFVEEQDFVGGAERAGEQNALLLTARERAVIFPRKRCQSEHLHRGGGARLLRAGIDREKSRLPDVARKHDLAHGGGKFALRVRLLGQIADLARDRSFKRNAAAVGFLDPEHHAHEGGLSRAVFADDGQKFARFDRKRDVVKGKGALVEDRERFNGNDIHCASAFPRTSRLRRIRER